MTNYQNTASTWPRGSIGVLMLDTHFPRFNGDIGNADTWPFNVVFSIIKGASARDVVGATSRQNLAPYITAAQELQANGVSAITTSCGFLSIAQQQIASQLSIPFVASSLVQVPWLQTLLPESRPVGILTIDAKALTTEHLQAAGINTAVPIKGCERGRVFNHAIMNDSETMDQSLCEQENVEAACELLAENPDLGAIVLECTNMAPYASAISTATGLPVYSIYTLICWLESGLSPRVFS